MEYIKKHGFIHESTNIWTLSHTQCYFRSLPHRSQHILSRQLWKHLGQNMGNLNKWKYYYWIDLKTLWQKQKLIIMSNYFSILHNVFLNRLQLWKAMHAIHTTAFTDKIHVYIYEPEIKITLSPFWNYITLAHRCLYWLIILRPYIVSLTI